MQEKIKRRTKTKHTAKNKKQTTKNEMHNKANLHQKVNHKTANCSAKNIGAKNKTSNKSNTRNKKKVEKKQNKQVSEKTPYYPCRQARKSFPKTTATRRTSKRLYIF